MSDLIRKPLQSLFISLQEELLKAPIFKDILSAAQENLEDDGKGAYKYLIPLKDNKGFLILAYENAEEGFEENTFIFQFRKIILQKQADLYIAVSKDLEEWLEQEGALCQWGCEQEDGKAWAQVTTSLTKSWNGPSSNKLEELSECVKEAWGVLEKWDSLVVTTHTNRH